MSEPIPGFRDPLAPLLAESASRSVADAAVVGAALGFGGSGVHRRERGLDVLAAAGSHARVQDRVEHDRQRRHGERQVRRVRSGQRRIQHEPRQQRRPGPQDHDAATVTVAEVHQPVVEMALVGGGQRLAPGGTTDDGEQRVEDRHAEDQERDRERSEEEVRLTDELVGERVGAAADHARRHGEQHAEQQRPQSPIMMRAGLKLCGGIRRRRPRRSSPAAGRRCPNPAAEIGQLLAVEEERQFTERRCRRRARRGRRSG